MGKHLFSCFMTMYFYKTKTDKELLFFCCFFAVKYYSFL